MYKSVFKTKTTKKCAYFDTLAEAIYFINSFINGCQEVPAKVVNESKPYGIIFKKKEYLYINFYQN